MKKNLCATLMIIFIAGSMLFVPNANALIFTFSDKDFLSGASWGTMNITAFDADTLQIRYDAAYSSVPSIPSSAEATGFGFTFDAAPTGVSNPANGVFSGDRDDLMWKVLNNLNSIPQPANGDEFTPPITKFDFTFGATEGNQNNISPPGILLDEFDVYYIDFTGVDFSILDLSDFLDITGVRIQNAGNINGGSLFLVGRLNNDGGGGGQVPEPGTILLLGSGLVGFALYGRKKFNKKI